MFPEKSEWKRGCPKKSGNESQGLAGGDLKNRQVNLIQSKFL